MYFIFNYVYVSLCGYVLLSVGVHRGQKRAPGALS